MTTGIRKPHRRWAIVALVVAGVLTIADIGVAAAVYGRGFERSRPACVGLENGGGLRARLRQPGSNMAGNMAGNMAADGVGIRNRAGCDRSGSGPGRVPAMSPGGSTSRGGSMSPGGAMPRSPWFNRPPTSGTTTSTTTTTPSGT